jgi:hypothetical protein
MAYQPVAQTKTGYVPPAQPTSPGPPQPNTPLLRSCCLPVFRGKSFGPRKNGRLGQSGRHQDLVRQGKNSIIPAQYLPNRLGHTMERKCMNAHLESDKALVDGSYRLSVMEA